MTPTRYLTIRRKHSNTANPLSSLLGFSLLELLVVVVILATLAAIVVPIILKSDDDAKLSAAQQIVRQVEQRISLAKHKDGEWPANIQQAWFHSTPKNPFALNHRKTIYDDVDGSNNANKWQPNDKTTKDFPFWYNRRNGAFRIRVPEQASAPETLELYNKANQQNAAD